MRLKCIFCKYKDICIPEQESHLTEYKRLQRKYIKLLKEYDELYVKHENLKYNLQQFIRTNSNH